MIHLPLLKLLKSPKLLGKMVLSSEPNVNFQDDPFSHITECLNLPMAPLCKASTPPTFKAPRCPLSKWSISPSENCLKPQKSGSKWLPRRSHPLPEAACQLSRRSIFHSPTQSDRSSRSAGALVQILINFLLLMISLICWSKWLSISSQFLNFECCCVCLPSIAWWEHFTCLLISKLIGSWQQKLIFCTESPIESAVDCDYSTRKKINQISSKMFTALNFQKSWENKQSSLTNPSHWDSDFYEENMLLLKDSRKLENRTSWNKIDGWGLLNKK